MYSLLAMLVMLPQGGQFLQGDPMALAGLPMRLAGYNHPFFILILAGFFVGDNDVSEVAV